MLAKVAHLRQMALVSLEVLWFSNQAFNQNEEIQRTNYFH